MLPLGAEKLLPRKQPPSEHAIASAAPAASSKSPYHSKPLHERPSAGRQLSGLALLCLTGALVVHAPELPPSGIGPFLNDDRARAMMFRLPRGRSFCQGKLAGGRGYLLPATCPTPLIRERWLSAGLCGRLRADAFAGATYFTHSAYLSLSNSRFAGHHTE